MLKHRYSLYGFLGAVAGGAVLSVVAAPLVAVPIVGFVAAESIAALFLPGSRWWRDRVDSRHRGEHREAMRKNLLAELEKRVGRIESAKEGETYRRMLDRVQTLARTAAESISQVTPRDVERLDDATVNYLSLWLLGLVLRERQEAFRSEDLDRRVAELDKRLKDETLQGADRARFRKARVDLEKVVERRTSVESHLAATRSGMLTMADGLEEIFSNVMQNPQSTEVRAYLDTAIEQVRVAEGIEAEMVSLDDAFAQLERDAAAALAAATVKVV
jgi:hypothetical protein